MNAIMVILNSSQLELELNKLSISYRNGIQLFVAFHIIIFNDLFKKKSNKQRNG